MNTAWDSVLDRGGLDNGSRHDTGRVGDHANTVGTSAIDAGNADTAVHARGGTDTPVATDNTAVQGRFSDDTSAIDAANRASAPLSGSDSS